MDDNFLAAQAGHFYNDRMYPSHLTAQEMHCLDEFRNRVEKAIPGVVVEYRLFGSRARGEGHAESDVDVLVLTTRIDIPTKHVIWDAANDLLLERDVCISPLVMTAAAYQQLLSRERLLATDIERDGIRL